MDLNLLQLHLTWPENSSTSGLSTIMQTFA